MRRGQPDNSFNWRREDRVELAKCRFHSVLGIPMPKDKKDRHRLAALIKKWRRMK
jgi:hypothetical protein